MIVIISYPGYSYKLNAQIEKKNKGLLKLRKTLGGRGETPITFKHYDILGKFCFIGWDVNY